MATPRHPQEITINGKDFKIFPSLTVWVQAAIQKNIGALFVGGAEGFEAFSDEKFTGILQKLLGSCAWMEVQDDGFVKPRQLSENANVEDCFQGDTGTMYMLAFEVLRYNKFPFFEKLVVIGKEKLATSGFEKQSSSEKKTPEPSGT
jgi:hypothetical protein